MIIGINYNRFDMPSVKKYNNNVTFGKRPNQDTFNRLNNSAGAKMESQSEISKLKKSKKLEISTVDFIPEMLDKYYRNPYNHEVFADLYISKLNKIKFYLSKLPENLLKENQTLFKNEFVLADKINKVSLCAKTLNKEEFDKNIEEAVSEYNKLYQDDVCGK